jgi:hypothetical protein
MNHHTFHSATLALIRKRDGEVLLIKATRKNPQNGRAVGFWDLPRTDNTQSERADQATYRMARSLGFGIVESIQELASSEIEENIRNISKRKLLTLTICDVDERSSQNSQNFVWSSTFIAAKLLEEANMPPVFLGKILELGMYLNHKKPTFDFAEMPLMEMEMQSDASIAEAQKKQEIAPNFES